MIRSNIKFVFLSNSYNRDKQKYNRTFQFVVETNSFCNIEVIDNLH